MQSGPAVYEERYRWTPVLGWVLLGCGAFVLISIVTPMPLLLRAAGIAVFGWFAVTSLTYTASRKVALRVDHAGITLGGSPFRYRATTRFFPWADVEKIILWKARARYISVERRPGAPPLSSGGTGMADKPALRYSPTAQPPVPGIAAGATRSLSACRLDDGQLAAAIADCAPTVEFVNLMPQTPQQS